MDTLFDYTELYLATAYTDGDTTLDLYAKNDTYKMTDQKTSSLITDFYCVIIARDDETKFMGIKISNLVENGTFQGKTRYTATIATSDGSNPMVGLANTYDGTTADANIIAGNKLASLSPDSLVLCTIGAGILKFLYTTFLNNVANRGFQAVIYPSGVDLQVGDDRGRFQVFDKYDGDTITKAYASVGTAGTTGNTTIQIYNVTQGYDVLSTPITIASGATSGNGVIDATKDKVTARDILRIDIDSVSTTAPQGFCIVSLELTN